MKYCCFNQRSMPVRCKRSKIRSSSICQHFSRAILTESFCIYYDIQSHSLCSIYPYILDVCGDSYNGLLTSYNQRPSLTPALSSRSTLFLGWMQLVENFPLAIPEIFIFHDDHYITNQPTYLPQNEPGFESFKHHHSTYGQGRVRWVAG